MSSDSTPSAFANSTLGSRFTEIKNLKALKSPEEGGTKKDYEDFLDKIQNHMTMAWSHGKDIGYVVGNGKEPEIPEPGDLTTEEEKSKFKSRMWHLKVDQYVAKKDVLEERGIVCAIDE